MTDYFLKKCSVVNELERWKCYGDKYFSNQATISAGYPKPITYNTNTEQFLYVTLFILLSISFIMVTNKLLTKGYKLWKRYL